MKDFDPSFTRLNGENTALRATVAAQSARIESAESLLRRYNLSGESKTLDDDVIDWLTSLRQSQPASEGKAG